MAQDATQVRVALTGHVWIGDEDASIPADVETTPSAGFVDAGFTSEDGVTFSIGRETTDILGWQSREPLRRLITAEPKTAAFTLRQFSGQNILNTLGGTITETEAESGLFRWEPDEGSIPTRVVLIDFIDGEFAYRFGFRRAQNLAAVDFSLVNNDAVNLPNEWSALAVGGGVKSWFIDSNDPEWADLATV